MYNSRRVVPTAIEFYDIAGLVRGASKGEGLGNKFLGHIREVAAIVHVVRCFEDQNIVHVDGKVFRMLLFLRTSIMCKCLLKMFSQAYNPEPE